MKISIRPSTFDTGAKVLTAYRPRERSFSLAHAHETKPHGFWIVSITGRPVMAVRDEAEVRATLIAHFDSK